jgi:L-lactate dehydrogenase (cytochrome)
MNRPARNNGAAALTGTEVAKHNNRQDCWVIVHGKAFDVTDFLPDHPGGENIILKFAGKDATETYDPIHPPDTLDKYLDQSKHLGPVDMNTVEQEEKEYDPEEEERQKRIQNKPILEQCYNLMDFEAVARHVMKKTAWAYYSSGADDEIVRDNPRLPRRANRSRPCARTIPPSTKSGSGRGCCRMYPRSTSPRRCWARKSTFPST